VIARVRGMEKGIAMVGGAAIESMIMKMAKANHSNMKNLVPLIKPGTPPGSARPRMNREPIEKTMVRIMPRMPRAVFIVISVTTLSMNPSYVDPYFFP